MKLSKIRLNGFAVIDLPVEPTMTDKYILKTADGLGPPEVAVSIADTLNAGGVYQGRQPQSREIVLTIALNPNYTAFESAGDLRAALYGLLTPGYADFVLIEFFEGTDTFASTKAYVKKFEISPFSKDPEVQVTLRCVEQYLQGTSVLNTVPASKVSPVIFNQGSAPSGFSLVIEFTAAMNSWAMNDNFGRTMLVSYPFQIGDQLVINTQPGNRGIYANVVLFNSFRTKNIIYGLSAASIWHQLHTGDNIFFTSNPAFDWITFSFLPRYWGI